MKRIVLLRHGESLWNKENRFTGWTDVDLSEKGVEEACKAGDALREAGFSFEAAYTSYLKRAVKTLNCVLDRLDKDWIPDECRSVSPWNSPYHPVSQKGGQKYMPRAFPLQSFPTIRRHISPA